MSETTLERIAKEEDALYAKLWSLLGDDGLDLLSKAFVPLTTYTVADQYRPGMGENFEVRVPAEELAREVFSRRKVIEVNTGILSRIHKIGHPPAEEKPKKAKTSYK